MEFAIKIAMYPKDGLDFIKLLKSANLALECAKESSRTSYEYYNEERKCGSSYKVESP